MNKSEYLFPNCLIWRRPPVNDKAKFILVEKVVHQYDETKKFSIKIIKRLIKEYNADY